ncbi:hypothetical protein [Streptomyces sp. A-14]|uniref:hypothetical protein n=1 Tax=Streptomyces sp. A-14 TaxID=3127467 RepID=UPI003EB87D2F
MDLHTWITQQVDESEAEGRAMLIDPTPILRRCEADRRILAIHCSEEAGYSAACGGCGTEGDCDDWISENLNDCPILLALAHAHGITPDVLAGLDRPQPPEPKPRGPVDPVLAGIFARTFGLPTPPITTSDVPEALRGPRWKP